MTSHFRVGLIGYGFVGKTFHAPLIQSVPELQLVAVSSRDASKVHADLPHVTVYDTPERLIDDETIDLVVLATPNVTHAPLAKEAMRKGKHVVVDKPFTLDLKEARELLSAARETKRLLSVFQNRRWDSDYLTIKQALQQNLVGEVTHFESKIDRFSPQVRQRWREENLPGSGVWFDLGPHLIDQVLQLFGLPDNVTLSLAKQRAHSVTPDWAHAILSYGEKRVILQSSKLTLGGSARFVVHGTEGSLVKQEPDQQEPQLLKGMTPGAVGWGDDPDPLVIYKKDQPVTRETALKGDQRRYYTHLAAALAQREENPVRPIEALAVMAVIEAGETSFRNGETVALPLTEQERREWHTASAS
ncbi:oxidoreductase [Saccharibacter sp. 17.LH.SD]|nr:oxidoreductase [Saccharibacter sp. 17.LH.SD]